MKQVLLLIVCILFAANVFAQNDNVSGDKVSGDKVMGNKITIYQTTKKNKSSNSLPLQIIDLTIKIRGLLINEAQATIDTINNYEDESEKIITFWKAPNEFGIQQTASFAQIDASKTIKSIIPLLIDKNVAVSSGAVVSLSKIVSNTNTNKKKKLLISLIYKEIRNGKITSNLEGACFQKYDFTSLKGTDVFWGANITGADFSYCKLDSLDFEMSQAEYANFSKSTLINTNFKAANLKGAKFWGVFAPNISFKYSNLKFADFGRLYNSYRFKPKRKPVETKNNYFVAANLENANFENAMLDRTNFTGSNLGFAKFKYANLYDVDFNYSFLTNQSESMTKTYIESQHPSKMENCKF